MGMSAAAAAAAAAPAARRLRVGCEAMLLCSCVTIQLLDRSAAACCSWQHLEIRDHAFFDSKI